MGKTKERIHVLTAAVLSVMFLVSCGQVKDIAYFQDKALDHPEEIDRHGGIVIQPKDMISIVVSSSSVFWGMSWTMTDTSIFRS